MNQQGQTSLICQCFGYFVILDQHLVPRFNFLHNPEFTFETKSHWLSYEQNVKTVSYSCVNDESMSASSASSSDFSVTKWVWSSLLRHNFLPVFSLECVTWYTIIIFTLESCNIISGWVTQLDSKANLSPKICVWNFA